ncbi:MAG: hypothetical protein ACTSYR_03390 [Candidatus Odinarchaeia archaeon]
MSADVRAGKLLYAANIITEEDLSSQIDGFTTEFALVNEYVVGSLKVYLNGLRQQKGVGKDYIEVAPDKIEFSYVPEVDDIILVDYIKK